MLNVIQFEMQLLYQHSFHVDSLISLLRQDLNLNALYKSSLASFYMKSRLGVELAELSCHQWHVVTIGGCGHIGITLHIDL